MEPIKYVTSLLTFYLKGEIKAEQNFISFREPNTILGLIPLGAKSENVAINQISSTQSNMKVKIGKLLLGVVLLILAFSMLGSSESGGGSFLGFLIFAILSANSVLDAFEIDLHIVMTSGQMKVIDFFIFDKKKAELAAKQINEMISNRLNDTNGRQQTDRIVDAINNK